MDKSRMTLRRWAAAFAVMAAAALGGCDGPTSSTLEVPEPVDLLLPHEIRIHPFTGTRTFDRQGGIRGVDVRIEAVDAYGDATKAFGTFRFEMYSRSESGPSPTGAQLATWRIDLLEPDKNLLHWDNITRSYQFKLQWDRPLPVGKEFVLKAVFDSPFTPRLFAEREFVSGQ